MLVCLSRQARGQAWEPLDSLDVTRRIGAASCVAGGKGYAGFGHDHNIAHPFNDVWSYDPALNRWSNVDYFDGQFRTFPFMFACGDAVYFGGGTNDSGKTALRSFMRYDTRLQTITQLGDLPFGTAMGAVTLTLNDSTVYLTGGCVRDSCNPYVYVYHADRDEWQPLVQNRQAGRFGFAFLLDSCIYTGLEATDEINVTDKCWKLDLRNLKWVQAAAFPGKARTRVVCGGIDDHRAFVGLGTRATISIMYPVGRFGRAMPAQSRVKASFFRDVYVYDTRSGQWSALPLMEKARRSAVAFAIDGYLYVGMGNVGQNAVRDFNRLKL